MDLISFAVLILLLGNVANTDVPTSSVSTSPDVEPIYLESSKAELLFSISVNGTFCDDLKNKRSETYTNYSSEFQLMLFKAFATTPGLQTVEIKDFRIGSAVADYSIILYGARPQDLHDSLKFINKTVKHKLMETNITIDSLFWKIDITNMSSQIEELIRRINSSDVCGILLNPCAFGRMCVWNKSVVFCQDECHSSRSFCSYGGECYVDYRDKGKKCRCRDNDQYVYSGDRCEVGINKVQSLSLSIRDYAIIAGSTAGIVVFILIIYNLIKCLRKKHRKGKADNDIDNSKSDINATEVSMKMNTQLHGKNTNENYVFMQASGRQEINKGHRLYRDPLSGEDALIYQPTNITRPLSFESREHDHVKSESTSRRSIYDNIDTENPYRIVRPNMKESRNRPL